MRDWLALPSPRTSSTQFKSGSSDELMTTDDEAYDIISKATTTEEELEEEEEDGISENEEDLSSWLSILNVFSNRLRTPTTSSLSSSSITSVSREHPKLNLEEQEDDGDSYRADEDENLEEKAQDISAGEDENLKESAQDISADEDEHLEERDMIEDMNNIRDIDDETHFQRDSSSSIASSTDTDNSTPANSQIISSSSKYYQQADTLTHVKICWNYGGKVVQVTGEFDNWSTSVNMIQDAQDTKRHVVEIPMDLTRDIEFKFIVDGEWRYAADLPHRTDWRGNINNVIYKKKPSSA